MIKKDNKYSLMQKAFYNESKAKQMATNNHRHHDNNRHYWRTLLKPIRDNSAKWKGKVALDFGCGTGRNVSNLLRMADWKRVDGVDISKDIVKEAEVVLEKEGNEKGLWDLYVNNGIDLRGLKTGEYDFIMSTITLQHIAVYDIRFSLLSEIFRVLKKGGTFSFQMGFGEGSGKAEYKENAYHAEGTNSKHDVIIRKPEQIKNDLRKIGFKNISYRIKGAYSDGCPFWIFCQASKP